MKNTNKKEDQIEFKIENEKFIAFLNEDEETYYILSASGCTNNNCGGGWEDIDHFISEASVEGSEALSGWEY